PVTKKLHLVVDTNIPQAADAFSGLGEVTLAEGRALRREHLTGADVLLVRSITRVTEELLVGTPVRFVGTATIGTDHVDTDYLRDAGIGFASAAGCNANSVAEYIVAALLEIAALDGGSLAGRTLGVVGCGNIGSRVMALAGALGMRVLVNDPPRQRARQPGEWTALDALLADSDIVTLHVPLNTDGPDRTVGLLDAAALGGMKPSAWLINTSRGAVVPDAALRAALETGELAGAILDVWESEPGVDPAISRLVEIGTPHIAGYSIDGKLNGTRMMLEAVCRHFGRVASWDPDVPPLPEPVLAAAEIAAASREETLRRAVSHSCPLRRDHAALRAGLIEEHAKRAAHFDRLRREYPIRHEFRHFTVKGRGLPEECLLALQTLGFGVA
ncbi:MAG: 4-phosphoerythronate dehydrogenase, partial [Candidatus Sumerlaeia bacterium]|nr:4-phosphoerythronate dehydrogenase [Candidatus Sumerlaeia bacterium]